MNGRAIERDKDGGETVWGTVLSFFRPNHLVIAWQISPDRTVIENESGASRVDVRFVAQDARQDRGGARPSRLPPPRRRLGKVSPRR